MPAIFCKVVLLTPVLETFMVAWLTGLLSRVLSNPIWIGGVSALVWGALHGMFAWPWFFNSFVAFFIFTSAFLVWRPTSFWHGYMAAFIPHLINNFIAALLRAGG